MDTVDGYNSRTTDRTLKNVEKSSEYCDDTRYDSGYDSTSSSSLSSWHSVRSGGSESFKELREQIAKLSVSEEDEKIADNAKIDNVRLEVTRIDETDFSNIEKCDNVVDRITDDSLVIYGKDCDGDTLLHIAIIQEATDLIMEFIQAAPWYDWLDIYNDKLRQTPLHLATLMGLTRVVRRLVVGGANVEMCDHNGDTALHIACAMGHEDIVTELLRPVETEETQINEYHTRCQQLPQNLEMRNYDGQTCLHIAASKGHTKIMKMLLDKGAQINAGDGKSGATVLHYAADRNDTTLGDFILSHKGVCIDKEMYNGATALMVARGRRNSEIVELLAKFGADCSKLNDTSDSSTSDDD